MLMSCKIKLIALIAAVSLFACSAAGCKEKPDDKSESSVPTVSDNQSEDTESTEALP